MRSNSGSGKSKNNLRDPTLKEHEISREKSGNTPAHGRGEAAEHSDPNRRQPAETGPSD